VTAIILFFFKDNFAFDGNYSSDSVTVNKNILYQKYQVKFHQNHENKKLFFEFLKTVDTWNKGENIKKIIAYIIASHSNIGQTRNIKNNGLTMKIFKTEDLSNIQILNEGLSKMKLPSFCDLVNNINCFNYFENITITVNLFTLSNYRKNPRKPDGEYIIEFEFKPYYIARGLISGFN
jgi:hypothetical protein